MSSTLVYKLKPKTVGLPDDLKFSLQKQYQLPREFDEADLEYLRGLQDAGVKGAGQLVRAIEKHDSVDVSEEY